MTGSGGPDVIVVGAGVIGAACAYFSAAAGLRVCVLDRGAMAGGTTSAGEGNLLVSDKEPGPELELALLSRRAWKHVGRQELAGTTLADYIELIDKGGLIVAGGTAGWAGLQQLATRQRQAGVDTAAVPADRLSDYEPHLAPGLAGGVFYPQDAQLQPIRAAAALLRLARDHGATVLTDEPVTGLLRGSGARRDRVVGVRTDRRTLFGAAVVNAAGTWAAEVADLAGVRVPIAPRRGFVLVTQPLPELVRHKVYLADYVADVASDEAGLQASPVVEGTPSGTILIGATRERVGFDRALSIAAVSRLAADAVALFPVLAGVQAMRVYRGFRPFSPDHLPVIGADPRAPGLWHACGHEGAGIGLAAGTGQLLAQQITGAAPDMDISAFRPDRFDDQRTERADD